MSVCVCLLWYVEPIMVFINEAQLPSQVVFQSWLKYCVYEFKVTKNSQCCKIMYELMFTDLIYFKLHF